MIGRLAQVEYVSVEDEIREVNPDLRTFFNVNSMKDLETAEQVLSKGISPDGASLVQDK
jgi:molybdopterin-guanine dinucleotide biosynthesis protein A